MTSSVVFPVSLNQKLGLLAVLLASFWFLLPRVAGHVTAGDAAELALAGHTLGVAHSPGYPVFSIWNHLLGRALHFGNAAYRQNAASCLTYGAGLVLLGIALTKRFQNGGAFFLPFFFFLLSPSFQKQALVTEVFPLAFFWASLLLLAGLLYADSQEGLCLVSFLLGLGSAVHQTLLLMAPGIALFFLPSLMRQPRRWKNLVLFLGFFMLGATIHLFPFIRSRANPVLDWEDPQTMERWWGLLTRSRYGFLQLAQGSSSLPFDAASVKNAFACVKNLLLSHIGISGAFLFLLGTGLLFHNKETKRLGAVLWLVIFFTGPFFLWMARAPAKPSTDLYDRFGLLPLIGAVLLMGGGVLLIKTRSRALTGTIAGLLLLVYLAEKAPLPFFRQSPAFLSLRWDLSIRESGLNILRHLPLNAFLLADRADETEFSLAYLLYGESRRPDVRFVDANAGVSVSIYGDDYYRIWGKPRLERRKRIERKIVEESSRPIFYATVDPLMIDLRRTPWGMIYRAWDSHETPPVDPYRWDSLLSFRFTPLEERSRGVLRANTDLLGRAFFDKGLFNPAERIFGLAQKMGGAHRLEQMGYLYQTKGMRAEAQRAYREALQKGVSSVALYSNLGVLEMDEGRVDSAISLYEAGLKRYPNAEHLLYNLNAAAKIKTKGG